jgi:hypothetical protein
VAVPNRQNEKTNPTGVPPANSCLLTLDFRTSPPGLLRRGRFMTSERKNEANRRNAQLSTGPRTPEGKARASRNALKHGLTAEDALLPGEDPASFGELLRSFEDEYQPASATDLALVHQLASSWWRLRRARRFEGNFVRIRLLKLRQWSDLENVPEPLHTDFVVTYDGHGRKTFAGLSLQESRVERLFFRTLQALQNRPPTDHRPPDDLIDPLTPDSGTESVPGVSPALEQPPNRPPDPVKEPRPDIPSEVAPVPRGESAVQRPVCASRPESPAGPRRPARKRAERLGAAGFDGRSGHGPRLFLRRAPPRRPSSGPHHSHSRWQK